MTRLQTQVGCTETALTRPGSEGIRAKRRLAGHVSRADVERRRAEHSARSAYVRPSRGGGEEDTRRRVVAHFAGVIAVLVCLNHDRVARATGGDPATVTGQGRNSSGAPALIEILLCYTSLALPVLTTGTLWLSI